MAMIETNFIRPQEVYDRNTGESKVRYRSYDGNDRFIPVVDGEKGVPKTMVEVTHAELKAMRDNGKLTAGALYRITDYQCTTTQENTQSAGHQFDIVLLALSEDKLAEEGWAMMHDNIYDVTFGDGVTKKCWIYILDGGTECNIVDISTKLGYSGIMLELININEKNKTASTNECDSSDLTDEGLTYNYFQNSNLSAWKVWYCLDNDTSRFAWADDSVDSSSITLDAGVDMVCTRKEDYDMIYEGNAYFAWYNEHLDTIYTLSQIPTTSDKVFMLDKGGNPEAEPSFSISNVHEGTGLPNGRGVIYRLIDEFNNDIKYDFKNIQFKRTITDGQYDANGTETWCYTLNLWYNDMCQDASILGNTLPNEDGGINGVYDNVFGYITADGIDIGVNTFAFALGNNVVLSFDDDGYFGIYSNTIGNGFASNTIGNHFMDNTIGNWCFNNTIGNDFTDNTIGNSFNGNTIGNGVNSNTIGNLFFGKTISNGTSAKNYGNNGVELATKS